MAISMAEGTGFEPAVAFTTPVFKTGAFNRSATPPQLRTDEPFPQEQL